MDTPLLRNSVDLIAFDLDGTLVDSAADLHACINKMQQQLGGEPRSGEQVRQWIGNGVDRLLHRALTGQRDGVATDAQFAESQTVFNAVYGNEFAVHTRPYKGVITTLEQLAQRYKMVCVTNKPAQFTEPLLVQLELRRFFELVISGDSLARKKPDPLPLQYAARELGVDPSRGLMVGDSITDIKAARAAGYQAIGVSYGYDHGHPLQHLSGPLFPDKIIDEFSALLPLLS